LYHPDVVFRVDNKLYPWAVAAPFVVGLLAFRRPLPGAVMEGLYRKWRAEQPSLQKPKASTLSRWFNRIAGKREDEASGGVKGSQLSGASVLGSSPPQMGPSLLTGQSADFSGDLNLHLGSSPEAEGGLQSPGVAGGGVSGTAAGMVADQIAAAMEVTGVAALDTTLLTPEGSAEHKKYVLSFKPTSAQLVRHCTALVWSGLVWSGLGLVWPSLVWPGLA